MDDGHHIPVVSLESKNTAVSVQEATDRVLTMILSVLTELDEKRQQADIWESAWSTQNDILDQIQDKTTELTNTLTTRSAFLVKKVAPYEEEARRLIVLSSTYKNWANPMEAVNRRISYLINELKKILEPLQNNRVDTEALLERIKSMSENLSGEVQLMQKKSEFKTYLQTLETLNKRLTELLKQHDLAMSPAQLSIEKLEKTQKEIALQLPQLWTEYYLQKPLSWLTGETWQNIPQRMATAYQGMQLRMPVELPVTTGQWRTAFLRFTLSIIVSLALAFAMYRRWFRNNENLTALHMFKISISWIFLGFAFLAAAISSTGDIFRFFMALGNLSIILGQTLLAWDLRLFSHPEVKRQSSPLLKLLPLTFVAYILLYLPLIPPVLLSIWLVCIILVLIWRKFWPPLEIAPLKIEEVIYSTDGLILWICLLLTLLGLHIASLILYLIFVSFSLALELIVGGMSRISYLNENLPTEGFQAAIAGLLVALTAPIILVTVFTSVLLWVGTLPGGMVLLQEYIFKSVSIGSTQLNLLQVLLIVSAFFLTRAIVILGSRFLLSLPGRGVAIDATIIPPVQTAFTYLAWISFALFALHSLGMELSNLAMVAGGLSVGIGFGMQTIVNNFLSGMILIFSRILQVGDVIEVKGITGRVRKISVRETTVETFDNAFIYIPNSEFISGHLINWTRNNPIVRANVNVGVAYGTDTSLVVKTLLAVANAHESILKYPTPSVAFNNFGDNTLDFALYFWVKQFEVRARTCTEVRLEIEKCFKQNGIEIAFPQMDVHIKDLPARGTLLRKKHPRKTKPVSRMFSRKINLNKTEVTQ